MTQALASERRSPRFRFAWSYGDRSGTIAANTRSEARAELRRQLGLRRVPFTIVLSVQADHSSGDFAMANDRNNILGMAAQQAQMQALIEAEIRVTTRDLFRDLVGPYLQVQIKGDGTIDPQHVRDCATLAWRTAQYVYVATGMVKVDDAKTWG